MRAANRNGLDAANIQPAERTKKHTADFIARCKAAATSDLSLFAAFVAVAAQVFALALGKAFQ